MILKSIKFMALISFFNFNVTVALSFPIFTSVEEAKQEYEKLAKEYLNFIYEVSKIGCEKDQQIKALEEAVKKLKEKEIKEIDNLEAISSFGHENLEKKYDKLIKSIETRENLIETQNKMIEGLIRDKEDLKKNAGGGKAGIAKNTLIIAGAGVFLFFFSFMTWHLIVRDWVVTDPEIPEEPLFSEKEIAGLAN